MSTKGLEEALTLLEAHIKACGPCEHDVNICVCGETSALTVAREELAAIREAAKLYMQGWETADEARTLLAAIAKEE